MWRIIGTAVRGRGHVKNNIPVQDKICFIRDDATVITLADGAGSATLSHFGAERVVVSICGLLNLHFDQIFNSADVADVQNMIITEVINQLKDLVEEHKEPLKSFASTMLAIAVKGERVLILHLGDGEIGAIKNGQLTMISSSENGEYVNATYFTTSLNAVQHIKLFKSQNASSFSSFFLMSDGAADSLYSKQQRVFSPVIKHLELQMKLKDEKVLNKMLESSFESMVKQRTMDDCSFIMMTNMEQPLEIASLKKEEKEYLYSLLENKKNTSFRKFETMTMLLQTPRTINDIVKIMHLKKRYVKRLVLGLVDIGLAEHTHQEYRIKEGLYR